MALRNAKDFFHETESPGSKVNKDDQFPIICHRYFFSARYCSGKKVLEVSCGPGLGLGYLSKNSRYLVGGDITTQSIRLAREHYGSRANLMVMDAHALPFQNEVYDVVISLAAVIYYDLPVFLQECHRVLKKGGLLILNTPNKNIPGFRGSRLSNKYYSVPELFSLLQDSHFQAEFWGAFPARIEPGAKDPVPELKPEKPDPLRAVPKSLSRKIGRAILLLPMGKIIKKFLADIVTYLVYHRINLKPELTEADMEKVKDFPVLPLSRQAPDQLHRIIYVSAVNR
ncbi:MAG: class I SAM-dependent methyltransferase [bacterium]|nr:class I SAM-dependent methyltransferase [bacterium]